MASCILNWVQLRDALQGYAMVEYATKKEAEDAITNMNGQEFMTQPLQVRVQGRRRFACHISA